MNPLVLIVDDEIVCRELLECILDDLAQTVTAGDGEEALALLSLHQVDMMITDLDMPVMNGYELLATVRNDFRYKNLPVFVSSGRTIDFDRLSERGIDIQGFIPKPFGVSVEDIRASVAEVFGRSQGSS